MADDLQITMSAKGDLERDLKNTIKTVAKLEAQLRDVSDGTSNATERDVEKLTRQLDKAYDKSKTLSGAVDGLDRNLDQMGVSAQTAGRKTQTMTSHMDSARRKGAGLTAGWGKMIGVVAGVTAAIGATAGAFRLLGDSINEARDARKAMAQTEAVMRSMGRSEAPKTINKMIDSLAEMAGIDDDEIRAMTNTMFTFGNITEDTFTKANSLAVDLSARFGKDLQSSAVMVGKALNDPTKGLTALTRVGVSFTKQQSDQVKAMMETGDMAGAQKIIMKELTREVGGAAAAQADSIGKAQVAWGNLKEAIGETLLSVGTGSVDVVSSIKSITKSIKHNKKAIVSALQGIISWAFTLISVWLKVASVWLRLESIVLNGVGYLIGAISEFTEVLELLGIVDEGTANHLGDMADNMRGAGDAAGNTSKKFDKQARKMGDLGESMRIASGRTKELADALKQIKSKKVRIDVRTTLTDAFAAVDAAVKKANDTGDTRSPWGVGRALGASGLAAAHAGYTSALGGHQITSGVRSWGLGSDRSDHLRGRAMDVRGPRLGSYANAVRASGGYAAFHGQGGSRHLHVVPQTNRPTPDMPSGGDTLHAEVHFHGGAPKPFDVRSAVASGLRSAERSRRERGGR